jgi:hypothetical protein
LQRTFRSNISYYSGAIASRFFGGTTAEFPHFRHQPHGRDRLDSLAWYPNSFSHGRRARRGISGHSGPKHVLSTNFLGFKKGTYWHHSRSGF